MTCHHMHCKAFGLGENFDMHALKQVYIYVISVALYGLNQVQNFVWIWIFENPKFQHLTFALENPFQNLSTFWGWALKQKCRACWVVQSLFLEFSKLFRKNWSNLKRRNSLSVPFWIQICISNCRPNLGMGIKAML